MVLNRPHSVLVALRESLLSHIREKYVLITETDHLFLRPLPNLATENEAVGYPFHYMVPDRNPRTIALVKKYATAVRDKI